MCYTVNGLSHRPRGVISMRGLTILFSLVGIVASCVVEAEVIEVRLPGVHGVYTCEPSPARSAEFIVKPVPAVVRSVSIRLSGQTSVRQWFCDLDPPFDLPVKLCAYMDDPVTGGAWYTYGVTASATGPFEIILRFFPYAPKYFGEPSWDFLRTGGSVTVFGGGAPIVDLCWPIGALSNATVSGAFLVIDGDFPIPVEARTWGQIKSLFGE